MRSAQHAATGRVIESAQWNVADLAERARGLVGSSRRVLLGITGAPGAGKSTLAEALAAALQDLGAAVVAMDGFHLSNQVLADRGLLSRKGAIDTFDADGYVSLLRRLRHPDPAAVVYAPGFLRDIDEPVGGLVVVEPSAGLVITEGNYLLATTPPWDNARSQLDEVWYLDPTEDSVRLARLVRRHQQYGRTRREAERWAETTDAGNAELIRLTRERADLIILTD
jgi:pantothenate kinase